MRLDVYPTDAEAFEATAALATEWLRGCPTDRPATVALAGGRGGRGVMVALAARGDVPWARIDWFWGDERVVPADDPRSNLRLARESLFVPRGVAAGRIHPPPVELADAGRIAAAYAATIVGCVAVDGGVPVFDLVLLGVGSDGHIASLVPGCHALAAREPVAAVAREEVTLEPHVARVTLTPPVLRAARRVIVTATGDEKAAVIAAVLREPVDPERRPAQLVRPGETVRWVVDRAAAAVLLRDATPAAEPAQ
jgi:6-phosphogluconolactonase